MLSGHGSGLVVPTSVPTYSFIAYRRITWVLGSLNSSMRPVDGMVPSGSIVVLMP